MKRLFRRLRALLRRIPPRFRLPAAVLALCALFLAVNWLYQVARKPAELLFPVGGVLNKTPAETWREYQPIFRRHSTEVMTPALLAALAQVEGAGNPAARTYWRLRLTSQPFDLYKPASSAVGMYQITDATFDEAKRYCVHDHVVVESCWFNGLYSRVVPSHAIEMTSALLDRRVASAIERHHAAGVTPERRQDLAAVIHLCGAAAGDAYVARGFRLTAGQRCGDHDVGAYLARVNAMKRLFARMAAAGDPGL